MTATLGRMTAWVASLLMAGAAADAFAQPVVTAVRVDEPPVIDGLLADDAWRLAAHLSIFVQTAPVEGAAASEPTDVYIAYDGDNLYVGIRARYAEPGLMRANRADRDQIAEDDTVSLFFDPFRDRQRAYQFTVNGFGVQGDAILNSTGLRNRSQRRALGSAGRGPSNTPPNGIPEGDISWDALFVSAGAPSDDGWTAELAIPFKSLRYPPVDEGEAHRWGFQVSREIKGKDETVVWSPVSRSIAQFLAQMGVLEGLADLSTSRNLEILPTVTAFRTGALAAAGAFREDDVVEAGLNLKYGISSDLTADFTINPDFSQIESDLPQIDVNQRFPLFYPELRPFFLEGQEIFNVFAPITPIHTRTIIDPRYGGKVGRSSVGVLFADDEAAGKRDDTSDPAFGRTAKVAIGRARFDLYPECWSARARTGVGSDAVAVRLPDTGERRGETAVVGALEVAEDHQLDGRGLRAESRVLHGALHGDTGRVQGQVGVDGDGDQLFQVVHPGQLARRHPFQPGAQRGLHPFVARAARRRPDVGVERPDRRFGHLDDAGRDLPLEQCFRRQPLRVRLVRDQLVGHQCVGEAPAGVVNLARQSDEAARILPAPLAIHLGHRDDAIADRRGDGARLRGQAGPVRTAGCCRRPRPRPRAGTGGG